MVKSRYQRCRALRGCLPGEPVLSDGLSRVKVPNDDGTMRDWYNEGVPTDAQKLPSCVGRAVAQMLMAIIRRQQGRGAIARGRPIDGDAIWRRGREMFWKGDMSGGLYLIQGIHAAESLGLLRKGEYEVFRPANDLEEIDRYLSISPLLQATATWPAWDRPNPQNGQIARGKPDPYAGHATVIFDIQKRHGHRYNVFANSWGRGWGRHGYGILTEAMYREAALDRPLGLLMR